MVIELDPVDRITAGAVGEPGARTFFLQGRKGSQLVTLLVEKQQVQLLAASVVEILARVAGESEPELPDELPDEAMELEEPLVPEWRAGRLAIGYEEDRDMLVLEVEELLPDEEPGEEPEAGASISAPNLGEDEPDVGKVRFWATRDQMLALARRGVAVCASGRPTCQFCGNPIDAEGHTCPAMNGHHELGG
ncbi:MAG TPA: DUF3090 domain-containing protein [Actinomycetota bacterium]|nr:DUF3090 domain-containing protein [Actinomycetota bacterium]